MPKLHQLKTWPDYFEAVFLEKKTFDPKTGEYSGRQLARNVTYKLPGGGFGVEAGCCVLGIK